MAKKSSGGVGLFALATGLAAGAAAIFFSNKDNRQMVKKEVLKVEKEAEKMSSMAKKSAKKSVAKAKMNVKKVEKKVAKKVSPLKAVGKKAKKK